MQWPQDAPAWAKALVADPQTSGGLLVSCRADVAQAVLETFRKAGFAQAARIGALAASSTPGVAFSVDA